ncbi:MULTISPECIES: penicillin-binding protein 2 [Nocardiopsis]|uniref:Penicillin-binding protein 2 n=1 Tax=Nocardiopsis sinuspersici TaxID=501010 RepID=A0A1V3C2V0_9ACTN|nr:MULTISPECIES: penicillin-binding protein 2 [Nocardiopsis]OOC55023.1 penicillin-binding protein 2 [Nocardiopsis sinuspersici]
MRAAPVDDFEPPGRRLGRAGLVIAQVLVVTLFAFLAARLWYLQVPMWDHYREMAMANHHQQLIVPATRGQILDATGRPLVNNRTELVVSGDYHELMGMKDNGRKVLSDLSEVLDVSPEKLQQRMRLCGPEVSRPCWPGSPYQPVTLADDVEPSVALQIMERAGDFPGISAQAHAVRSYPQGGHAAQLVGYLQPITQEELEAREDLRTQFTGIDQVGRDGVEASYDAQLRGDAGKRVLGVNNHGEVMEVISETPPEPGMHLVTHIDLGVQKLAEKALAEGMAKARPRYKADSGAAVVLDVRTGGVVAMASLPTYDPAIWRGGIDQETFDEMLSEEAGEPLLSRAVQGTYPPGSTFKVSSLAAAAENGYSLRSTYACPGSVNLAGQNYQNYAGQGHGPISLHKAIVVSCNTVFYNLGYQMWKKDGGLYPEGEPEEAMANMARGFGFGSPTGIDLPYETSGRIPDREWKRTFWQETRENNCHRGEHGYPEVAKTDPSRAAYLKLLAYEQCVEGFQWRANEAVNFSIGQGDVLVTPLQLANAYAAVANGGTLHEPRIGRALVSADGSKVKEIEPVVRDRLPVSDKTLEYLQKALTEVPKKGTAAGAFAGFPQDKVSVAGKTGSADVRGRQVSSWFASYAPADDPQFAIAVLVSQGGTGGMTAAPIAREIYEGIYGFESPGQAEGEGGSGPAEPLLPGGEPPEDLPAIRPDGSIDVLDR